MRIHPRHMAFQRHLPIMRMAKPPVTTNKSANPKENLLGTLKPVTEFLATLNFNTPDIATAALEQKFPFSGVAVAAIFRELSVGLRDGWLVPKTLENAKFGGLSKDLNGFSAAAVHLVLPPS